MVVTPTNSQTEGVADRVMQAHRSAELQPSVQTANVTMSLSEENTQVLNLVQAMIGAVSPNLRRVTLEMPGRGAVHLRFVLEHDDSGYREEIEDIGLEFEALQTTGIKLEMDVVVDGRPIAELSVPGRVVFGRKE